MNNVMCKLKSFFENISLSKTKGLVLILCLVLVSHFNIFANQFALDDNLFILDWPLIQDMKNFPSFFTQYLPPRGEEGIYSPLKTLFHAINYNVFGFNTFGYHIISLLVHFLGIFLVYQICSMLTKNNRVAFLSSLLFALHPVQVEPIVSMTASVDMIGILFLFASFVFYIKNDRSKQTVGKNYFISALFALLAVFTHELAISLPVLFLWYDICFSEKKDKLSKKIFRILPFVVIVLLYVLSKYSVLGTLTRGQYVYGSFYLTMLVTIKAFFKYVLICFFPFVLTHNHVISPGIYSFMPEDFNKFSVLNQSVFDLHTFISLVGLIAIILLAAIYYKRNKLITFCIGWFFISLMPVSNIIPSGVYFGERYLYPGLLGFCLVLGILLNWIYVREKNILGIKSSSVAIMLIILVSGFYMIRTIIRNYDWKDDVSIMSSAVKNNPGSALMKNDLGIIYTQFGEYDKAIAMFKEALDIRKDPETYFSMADAYMEIGDYNNALKSLKNAVAIREEYPEAYYNMASIYANSGMNDKAAEYISRAVYYYQKEGRQEEMKKQIDAFSEYFGLDVNIKEIVR